MHGCLQTRDLRHQDSSGTSHYFSKPRTHNMHTTHCQEVVCGTANKSKNDRYLLIEVYNSDKNDWYLLTEVF
jgi:hypothetical protein